MKTTTLLAGVFTFALPLLATIPVHAGSEDFKFELVEKEAKLGDPEIIAFTLTDIRTNEPVEDAIIIATRLDMAPEKMETMTTPVELLPSEEPGIYRFKSSFIMAGGWRFSLAAKVQGELETVQIQSIIEVTE